MRGLTLTLPYPYLIAAAAAHPDLGKLWETRGWAPHPPSWRGELAIHAGKNLGPVGGVDGLYDLAITEPFTTALAALDLTPLDILDPARRGVIVAVADFGGAGVAERDLFGAWVRWPGGARSEVREPELSFGDYAPGRRVWRLDAIVALRSPVGCSGARGLWNVPPPVEAQVRAQLEAR